MKKPKLKVKTSSPRDFIFSSNDKLKSKNSSIDSRKWSQRTTSKKKHENIGSDVLVKTIHINDLA